MSSSLLHAAIAGAAFTIGVGTALALSPSAPATRPPRKEELLQPVDSRGNAFPARSGAPPAIFNGGLTVAEGPGRVIQPGQIGPIADFLQRAAYATAYDRRNRIPAWTAEHLTAASLKRAPTQDGSPPSGGDRSNSTFREDEEIPPMFRAHLLDYFRSGYDRGHMVPAADAKMSQKAMDETFLLSNVAPQVGEGFNRHYWAYVEAFCRNLTNSFEDVYVFTVPLFLPRRAPDGKWRVSYEMIAPPNTPPTIAVPTHFAKVVLASRPPKSTRGDKEWSLGAFVLPNEVIADTTPLTSFVVPVEAVESSAGLSLFPVAVKQSAKPLCQTVSCQLVIRRFDDAQKKVGGGERGKRERSSTL